MISFTCCKLLIQDINKWCLFQRNLIRLSSKVAAQSASVPSPDESKPILKPLPPFRTLDNRPSQHSKQNIGQFYTINPETRKQLFLHGGLPKQFETQGDTFQELSLMIREPALEIMSYLKCANYSHPVIRYALYGKVGNGKSLTLAHLMHYAHESEFIIVNVPWVPNWFKTPKECADSLTIEGNVDLPLDSAAWLIHFKKQNSTLLNKLQLTLSQDYVWSKRETTSKGSPLVDLIELGISRIKYASDCITVLLKELKQHSEQKRCKTFVAIDGFNAFFNPITKVRLADRTLVPPTKVTIAHAFLDITKFDWCNGAVVVTLDTWAIDTNRNAPYLPFNVLGKEGFEHIDPFVPVQVNKYSDKEFNSCLSYYADRNWLTHEKADTEEGRQELAFLSAMIPYQLMRICASI